MAWDWHKIEQYEGFRGLKPLVEREVIPKFEALPEEADAHNLLPPVFLGGLIFAFFIGSSFVAAFLGFVGGLIPNAFVSWVFGALTTLVIYLCFGAVVVLFGLLVFRKKIAKHLVMGQAVFLARAHAWMAICDHIGLTYVPAPGGAPQLMKILAKFSWAPPALRDAAEVLEAHAGMDEPLKVFQASGLALSNVALLGDEATRANAVEQMHANLLAEDGFHGERNGAPFDMFEWVQKEDEAPDIHHLIIVMAAPLHLNSTTQLRSRKVAWASAQDEVLIQNVDLGLREFEAVYRLRSTDQVEARAIFNPAVIERVVALAHGDAFRAVAKGEHIVFDIAGGNRFNMVELLTGDWSDESIRKGLTDIAEALELIDTLVHAFMIRNQPSGMTSPE